MRLRARTLFLPFMVAAVALPALSTSTASAATASDSFSAPPIASAGSIGPNQSVTFAVRTLVGGVATGGVVVYLGYQNSGARVANDRTEVPISQCNGQSQLPTNGTLIPCTSDANGQVPLTYFAPAQPPAQGRADWIAQDSASSPHSQAITHYVYTTVYRFDHSPIAPSGSLSAGAQPVSISLSASDGLDHGVANSTMYLSFKAANGGGSAKVGGTALTATPSLFMADANGALQVTYTAPSTPPPTGQDAILVQDAASAPTEVNSTSYAFAMSTPVVSVGDATVVEGDQIPGIPAKFTVTISAPQTSPVYLQYVTLCGIGDKGCGEDFVQVFSPITVTIPAGAVNATFIVRQFAYVGGNEGETYNEGWYVELVHSSVGVVGRSVGKGVLLPDQENGYTAYPNLSVGDVGLVPTNAVATSNAGQTAVWFTVTLGTQQTTAVTFTYSTANGTAVANVDYRATAGMATIGAGKTSAVIKVILLPNAPPQANKTFTLTISNAMGGSGVSISRAVGTGTLLAG